MHALQNALALVADRSVDAQVALSEIVDALRGFEVLQNLPAVGLAGLWPGGCSSQQGELCQTRTRCRAGMQQHQMPVVIKVYNLTKSTARAHAWRTTPTTLHAAGKVVHSRHDDHGAPTATRCRRRGVRAVIRACAVADGVAVWRTRLLSGGSVLQFGGVASAAVACMSPRVSRHILSHAGDRYTNRSSRRPPPASPPHFLQCPLQLKPSISLETPNPAGPGLLRL